MPRYASITLKTLYNGPCLPPFLSNVMCLSIEGEKRKKKKLTIVAGNEVFAASGKRLHNRQFANEREKNTVVTDGIRNEFFPPICYALHFLVPSTLPTIFRALCNIRDTLTQKKKEKKRREAETKNMMFLRLSVQSCNFASIVYTQLSLTTIFLT